MNYEEYDEEMHRLFSAAFAIRCNSDSNDEDLHEADKYIDDALSLSSEMEVTNDDAAIQHDIINDRLRCYIERLAIFTRLLKNAYDTPRFDSISEKHEHYCNRYKHVYSHINNEEIKQSQYQLTIMAYQSLAANYFRRGKMGVDKPLCQKAIDYIDKAIELTKHDNNYNALHKNKLQILQAMSSN